MVGRKAVDEASAGDIVVFSGLSEFNIGDTLVDPADPRPLDPISVEEPTMSISIGVNKSPFAGKAGKLLTSRNIRERREIAPRLPRDPPEIATRLPGDRPEIVPRSPRDRHEIAPRSPRDCPEIAPRSPLRLEKELETNVALQLKDTGDADSFQALRRHVLDTS